MILLIVVPIKFPSYNHIIPLSSNSADAHRGFADENSSPKDLGGGVSMVSEPSQVRAIKWVRIKLITPKWMVQNNNWSERSAPLSHVV